VTAVPPPEGSADPGVPWHYGDPHREQRALVAGEASVDQSHLGVVTVTGPDRLTWLNDLTTQHLSDLAPGSSALALILSPHGHVEHELHAADDGVTTWLVVEPERAGPLVDYLRSMQFLLRVEVADRTGTHGVVWEPVRAVDPDLPTWLIPPDFAGLGPTDAGADRGGDAGKYVPARPGVLVGRQVVVEREALADRLADAPGLAGSWALEALRVGAAVPRLGCETDHRTLPHEVGWIGPAVHLSKGCYRGQEAVARVHNLGRPPRRLVLLHLDGSDEMLPAHGDEVLLGDAVVGWVGTAARHFEDGPIATAVVRRSTPVDAPLVVRTAEGDVAAAPEVVVAP
jgi:folate-binding protein YgfZ